MTISIFGSQLHQQDSVLVQMLPKLKKVFPQHQFIYQDPTENLTIPKQEWWIVDLASGIKNVTVFDNLDNFIQEKNVSVHDYDLYLELKLNEKLGRLPKLKIIALPLGWTETKILNALKKIFGC